MSVLLDTGPLVAMFRESDIWHDDCVEQFRHLNPPLVTCWPVLNEAVWLLRNSPQAVQKLLALHKQGLYRIAPIQDDGPEWIAAFFKRYDNLEPQLADAMLMYLAEHHQITTIFTIDRRDFSIYRLSNGQALELLPR